MYLCVFVPYILKAFIKITRQLEIHQTPQRTDILANLLQLHLHIAVANNNNSSNSSSKKKALSEAAACCLTLEWCTRHLAGAVGAAFLGDGCQRPSHVALLITL